MKRTILLFSTAAITFIALSSHSNGPAQNHNEGNRTGSGAIPNPTCSGGGCHGLDVVDGTTFVVVKDVQTSQIVSDGKYTPGKTYDINLIVNRNGAAKFGMQFSATKTLDPTANIGSLSVPNPGMTNPLGVTNNSTNGINIVEHYDAIPATVGAMTVLIRWTAPISGNGDVTFNAIFNATNGNSVADTADHSFTTNLTLAENTNSVAELPASVKTMAYPNPAKNQLNLSLNNAGNGMYNLSAFDFSGRRVYQNNVNVNDNAAIGINTSSWSTGMYILHIQKDGAERIIPVSIQ